MTSPPSSVNCMVKSRALSIELSRTVSARLDDENKINTLMSFYSSMLSQNNLVGWVGFKIYAIQFYPIHLKKIKSYWIYENLLMTIDHWLLKYRGRTFEKDISQTFRKLRIPIRKHFFFVKNNDFLTETGEILASKLSIYPSEATIICVKNCDHFQISCTGCVVCVWEECPRCWWVWLNERLPQNAIVLSALSDVVRCYVSKICINFACPEVIFF